MARIQRYIQDRLASQAVGTPGIDESGSILGQNVAQNASVLQQEQNTNNRVAAGNLVQNITNAANYIGYELRTRQAAQQHVIAAKNKILTDQAVANHLYNLGGQIDDASKVIREGTRSNPDEAVNLFRKESPQIIEGYLTQKDEKTGLPLVPEAIAAEVRQKIQAKQTGEESQINNWAFTEKDKNAHAQVEYQSNDLIERAADVAAGDLLGLGKIKVQAKALGEVWAQTQGNQRADLKLQTTLRDGSEKFAAKTAEEKPEELLKMLENKSLEQYGFTKDVQYKNRAEARIKEINTAEKNEFDATTGLAKADLSEVRRVMTDNPKSVSAANHVIKTVEPLRDAIFKMSKEEQARRVPLLKEYDSALRSAHTQIESINDEKVSLARREKSEAEHLGVQKRIAAGIEKQVEIAGTKSVLDSPEARSRMEDVGLLATQLSDSKSLKKKKSAEEYTKIADNLLKRTDEMIDLGYARPQDVLHARNVAKNALITIRDKSKSRTDAIESLLNNPSAKLSGAIYDDPPEKVFNALNTQKKESLNPAIRGAFQIQLAKEVAAFKAKTNRDPDPSNPAEWAAVTDNATSRTIANWRQR